MKLPKKTQAGFTAKGQRKSPPGPGGGAAARAFQFELEHGVEPAASETSGKKTKKTLAKKVTSR
jgi:hypothetical protein